MSVLFEGEQNEIWRVHKFCFKAVLFEFSVPCFKSDSFFVLFFFFNFVCARVCDLLVAGPEGLTD